MRKFDKHKMFASDRPSNPALFNANQKSLNDLILLREQQDKGTFVPISGIPISEMPSATLSATLSATYTPWKTPSTS
jgi:hypothetical protein